MDIEKIILTFITFVLLFFLECQMVPYTIPFIVLPPNVHAVLWRSMNAVYVQPQVNVTHTLKKCYTQETHIHKTTTLFCLACYIHWYNHNLLAAPLHDERHGYFLCVGFFRGFISFISLMPSGLIWLRRSDDDYERRPRCVFANKSSWMLLINYNWMSLKSDPAT